MSPVTFDGKKDLIFIFAIKEMDSFDLVSAYVLLL
jgi:hypothetical protein